MGVETNRVDYKTRLDLMNGQRQLITAPVVVPNEHRQVFHLDLSGKDQTQVEEPNQVKKTEKRSKTFRFSMPSPHRSAALIRKNFMQTFRNIGCV